MSGISADEMASKLLADAFQHRGQPASEITDPIVDTPMLVTLDELQAYDHNPRVRRNPLYEEIRASIRERGLDSPPAITRRPGETKYIIRNGGNTRLTILRDLWSETRDDRFWRIHCLFRPWTVRGEITVLTGHLAENELHGRLSFIERALGVERARELYEEESQSPLSQSELARRLTADGFPVHQSHISRMRDAVQYLLPAIPTVLYGGLGRHQIERLAVLRRAGERGWELFAGEHDKDKFPDLFRDTLSLFDGNVDQFAIQRFQDELFGQMADQLGMDYARLTLEIHDLEGRQRALTSDPIPARDNRQAEAVTVAQLPPTAGSDQTSDAPDVDSDTAHIAPASSRASSRREHIQDSTCPSPSATQNKTDPLHGHIASAAPTTDRLKSIQRLVSEHLEEGEPLPDFEDRVVKAIPVQAGGLYPISDVWYIAPNLDTPQTLRIHISQLAHEIAAESHEGDCIQHHSTGLGYRCSLPAMRRDASQPVANASIVSVLQLLAEGPDAPPSAALATTASQPLGTLLIYAASARISDAALVKLFRLIRLARRLTDLTSATG